MWSATWLRWTLAAVMIATAGYHVARLLVARLRRGRPELDVDVTHAAMGVAMATMLVGSLTPGASRLWALGFYGSTVWFGARMVMSYADGGARAIGRPVTHALTSGAMLYMLVVTAGTAKTVGRGSAHASMPAMAGMSGHAMGASPGLGPSRLLGALLIAAMVGVAGWTVAGVRRRRCAARVSGAPDIPAPGVAAGCQVAMNVTTAYMLVLML